MIRPSRRATDDRDDARCANDEGKPTNDEERRRLIEFQRGQEDWFVLDAGTAGVVVASRVVPNGDGWLVQFRFEDGGGASWIVTDREGAYALTEALLLRVSLMLSLPAVA